MRARVVRAGALLSVAALVAIGCSAIVTSELEQVSCRMDGAIGPPSCLGKQICRRGTCVPCEPREVCGNGFDDDCNGQTDDHCDVDAGSGGQAGFAATGGDSGGGGSSGVGASGGVAGSGGGSGGTTPSGGGGTTGGTGGAAGTGGSTGGSGGTVAAGDLGATCTAPTDCKTGLFCTAPATLGASGNQKICTKGCCSTDDCGSGDLVCYTTSGGFGACLPVGGTGRPGVGAKGTGSTCATGEECRTGYCAGNVCSDTCCYDQTCPNAAPSCAAIKDQYTGRDAFICTKSSATGPFQWPCGSDSSCTSNYCLLLCTKSCCAKKDCGNVLNTCVYSFAGQNDLRICSSVTTGGGAMGASCTGNSDCQSGTCIDPGGGAYCSGTCCKDTDCDSGFKCAPVGAPSLLFCVKI